MGDASGAMVEEHEMWWLCVGELDCGSIVE